MERHREFCAIDWASIAVFVFTPGYRYWAKDFTSSCNYLLTKICKDCRIEFSIRAPNLRVYSFDFAMNMGCRTVDLKGSRTTAEAILAPRKGRARLGRVGRNNGSNQ